MKCAEAHIDHRFENKKSWVYFLYLHPQIESAAMVVLIEFRLQCVKTRGFGAVID